MRCEQQLLLPPSTINATPLLAHSLLSPTLWQSPHSERAAQLDDATTPTVLIRVLILYWQSWLLCLSSTSDHTKDEHWVCLR